MTADAIVPSVRAVSRRKFDPAASVQLLHPGLPTTQDSLLALSELRDVLERPLLRPRLLDKNHRGLDHRLGLSVPVSHLDAPTTPLQLRRQHRIRYRSLFARIRTLGSVGATNATYGRGSRISGKTKTEVCTLVAQHVWQPEGQPGPQETAVDAQLPLQSRLRLRLRRHPSAKYQSRLPI